MLCNRLITPETLDRFQFPDPTDPHRWEGYPNGTSDGRVGVRGLPTSASAFSNAPGPSAVWKSC